MTDQESKPSLLNIKAIGLWNEYIFKPEWIVKYILSQDEKKVNILFNIDNRDLGYDIDGIKIFPRYSELVIEIDQQNIKDENIELATKILIKTLKTLPHTPIKAIGFNIHYVMNKNSNKKIVEWANNNRNKYDDINTYEIRASKKFKDYSLNLIVDFEDDNVKINCNYNFKQIIEFQEDIFLKFIEETNNLL
jgi:hypothetical protein